MLLHAFNLMQCMRDRTVQDDDADVGERKIQMFWSVERTAETLTDRRSILIEFVLPSSAFPRASVQRKG